MGANQTAKDGKDARARDGRRWTDGELFLCLELYADGRPLPAIAERLGRNETATRKLIRRTLAGEHQRPCGIPAAVLNACAMRSDGQTAAKGDGRDRKLGQWAAGEATFDTIASLSKDVGQLHGRLGRIEGKLDELAEVVTKVAEAEYREIDPGLDMLTRAQGDAERCRVMLRVLLGEKLSRGEISAADIGEVRRSTETAKRPLLLDDELLEAARAIDRLRALEAGEPGGAVKPPVVAALEGLCDHLDEHRGEIRRLVFGVVASLAAVGVLSLDELAGVFDEGHIGAVGRRVAAIRRAQNRGNT